MSTVSVYTLFLLLVVCLNGCGFNMLCRGCREEERTALLEIKNSINNPEGTALSDWYGQDCCQWDEVECDVSTSRVIKIIIANERDEGLSDNWYPNASSFSQFEDLQELLLPGNHIAGFIMPKALQKLKNLQKLDLGGNSLDGSRLCWGKMRSLYHLDLSDNRLQGDIPSCVCESQSLTHLYLSRNMLQGNIDACLSKLSSLKLVDLSSNEFNGSFPSLLFRNLTSIEYLIASYNQFNGVVSLSRFANLSKLTRLDISYNNLQGEVLPSISSMPNLRSLFLQGNSFTGTFPDSLSLTNLEYLDLSDNNLQGEVLPRNSSMPNLKRLFLNRNGLTGTFPQSLSKSSSLEFLNVQHNSLSGELSTQFPALPHLRVLLLGGNHFEGQIPLEVCQMNHLRLLDLSNNNLSGDIPSCLNKITSWTEHPYSEGFKPYYYTGIAVSFWIKNRFINLTRMLVFLTGIDVSCNQLRGTIPVEMGELTNLRLINMSSNLLTGQIPASLGNMRDLESLDLSDNRLSDAIPQELTDLTFLSVFDVSFNNLSGALPPREKQFSVFEKSSYIGNPGLCGPPLTKECIEKVEIKKVEKSSCLLSKNMGNAYTMVFWCFIFLLYSL